jgi:hypothetical protein
VSDDTFARKQEECEQLQKASIRVTQAPDAEAEYLEAILLVLVELSQPINLFRACA